MTYKVHYLDIDSEPGDLIAEAPDYETAERIAEKHAWDRAYGTGILYPCGCWKWGSEPDMLQPCEKHDLQPLIERLREQVEQADRNWQGPWEEWFPEHGLIEVLGHEYAGGFNAAALTGEESVKELVQQEIERLHRKYWISDSVHEELMEILPNAARQALGWVESNRIDAARAREFAKRGLALVEQGQRESRLDCFEDALTHFEQAAKIEAKYDASLDYREALETAKELVNKVQQNEAEA